MTWVRACLGRMDLVAPGFLLTKTPSQTLSSILGQFRLPTGDPSTELGCWRTPVGLF
jgi:hypothetical protein